MGRWDIYWGPAHILIHPWDGWMSGRGGGGPLVVRISNRQDGGGNELLPGAGGGDPPTSQDPAAQRQQTNNFSAPCHSPSAYVLWTWDTSWHVKSVSWILKNACFIFLIARTSTLNIWHSFLWQWIHIFSGPKFDHCLALSILQSLTPLYDCETWLVKVVTWICQNWYMDFSKLLQGFAKVAIWFVKVVTWICQTCSMSLFSAFAKQAC